MQLRRFTADSTPAALGAVRMALGDDAIILANRRVGDQVEIIATGQIDDEATLARMSTDDVQEKIAKTEDVETALEATGSRLQERVSSSPKHSAEQNKLPPKLDDDTINISALSQEIAADSSSNVRPVGLSEKMKPSESLNRSRDKVDDRPVQDTTVEHLTAAIETHSQEISNRFRALEVNLWGNHSPQRSMHLQQLFGLGIGAELAIRLVERASPDIPVEDALRQSFALLKSTLPIGMDKTLSVPGVTIMTGAPGSGKTTALVKLATEHVKQSGNQSIVIICADTRRIGAFEELQAYGRLLGVPTVHAHDTAELDSLIHAFTHKQLVLIDHTLPDDEDSIGLPERLLNPAPSESVRHLFTLAATTQACTADAMIAKYCTRKPIQCVLTHLDSSARLGALFNAIIRHHLPIAYWSDVASVQKPLQKADASILVATAVAMSRRVQLTPDDEWLQRLIQPSHSLLSESPLAGSKTALEAS